MNKKKYDLIDYFMIFAIIFFMIVGSMSAFAQSYTITKDASKYEINFIDEFQDQWYLDGEPIIVYGKLNLTERDYKQLIKDIKKTLKQSEQELDRPKYAVIKYGWVKDSVWVYFDEKAFSVTAKDIDYFNSKL
tara:strand:- start:2957 stop:3355 length:399 start_codon:yes stop_codon:yes gene_type:complete